MAMDILIHDPFFRLSTGKSKFLPVDEQSQQLRGTIDNSYHDVDPTDRHYAGTRPNVLQQSRQQGVSQAGQGARVLLHE